MDTQDRREIYPYLALKPQSLLDILPGITFKNSHLNTHAHTHARTHARAHTHTHTHTLHFNVLYGSQEKKTAIISLNGIN